MNTPCGSMNMADRMFDRLDTPELRSQSGTSGIPQRDISLFRAAPGTWNFPQAGTVDAGICFSQPGRQRIDFHPAPPRTARTKNGPFILARWTLWFFSHRRILTSKAKYPPGNNARICRNHNPYSDQWIHLFIIFFELEE